MSTRWMRWAELPWLERSAPHASLIRLCDELAKAVPGDEAGFASILGEIVAEFGGPNCGIVRRLGDWSVLAQRGQVDPLPRMLLPDVLDRDAAVFQEEGGERTVVAPIPSSNRDMLVLSGNRVDPECLPGVLAVARVLGRVVDEFVSRSASERHVGRLKSTLQLARSFAGETDSQSLLTALAREACKLLECERASIFLWDREQRQLIACPALGLDEGKLWLPDNKGIVGEVVQNQRVVRVDDAYTDSRFDRSVDKQTGFKTRNLLCVPLFGADGSCLGAFELLNKVGADFSDEDIEALEEFGIQAAAAVMNTLQLEQLTRSNEQLSEQVVDHVNIIGESAQIVALRGTIERLAATDLPVLILGESGTGKEVAAQALHYQGPRAKKPFVAVNCAALTETLLESELFGHEKGAFTDAHSTHVGKFELAEGGTLFLDEIGDMSLGGQAKLLRVLEQKVITRVGGTQPISVNVRVLAATNAHLADMVREKKFRQDLYYRLSVVTLDLPPLRDRPEDVVLLAEFFLSRFCKQAKRKPLVISADARKRLQRHGWPGNVRELRNLMERVAFLTNGDQVGVDDLAFILSPEKDTFGDLSDGIGLMEATNRFQAEYIRRAVKRVQGNMSEAASLLGLHRSNLYRKMGQLGLEVSEVKTP
ncbi:MAG: sigma-54-dependent Fis family transcriptional regulator [Planctomycetaceae bacterium]